MALSPSGVARPFTRADLADVPDDGYRREIIDARLVVTPAPNARHQLVVGALYAVLRAASTDDAVAVVAPFDWALPDEGSVQPDIMVVRRADLDLDGPLPPTARPLLIVEVLSPSNADYDRGLKRRKYERLGVPAYWLVDPGVPSLSVLRLGDARYEPEAEVVGNEPFASEWPFPVTVVPAELL